MDGESFIRNSISLWKLLIISNLQFVVPYLGFG